MSALKSVQAGALLAVADVIVDYASEMYISLHGGDQRRLDRHLQGHLLKLSEAMRDKARDLQTENEVENATG